MLPLRYLSAGHIMPSLPDMHHFIPNIKIHVGICNSEIFMNSFEDVCVHHQCKGE